MAVIDLRSDTVTRPTPGMREAMARAEVGDDVYGEDPSINRLQEQVAALLGTEAALFVPSGTMGNQASLLALTRPGDAVLVGEDAHILLYEGGAPAALAGVMLQPIGRGGLFGPDDVHAAVRPPDSHYPTTSVVALENTHNRAGGIVFPLDALREVATAARERDLALHLDGARLWNAMAATGTPAAEWAAPFDTVSVCLSKGLGAPAGSLVCGSRERVRRIHRFRKRLGGGMRQAGILAAAGLYALEHHLKRLADDHAHARRLAEGLAELGFPVQATPETNMVFFQVEDAEGFVRETRARELWINPMDRGLFRAVTHLDVPSDAIDDALERLAAVRAAGVR